MKGQSRERMRSEHRRQEMAGSGSSPFHPSSLVVPDRGWRQIGGWGGRDMGLHVVLTFKGGRKLVLATCW
jgi:hypothetical protein